MAMWIRRLLMLDRTARLSHVSALPEEVLPAVATAARWVAAWDLALPAATADLVSAPPWVAALAAAAVKSTFPTFVTSFHCAPPPPGRRTKLTMLIQLPYTVGWQDLKDLFRQAGEYLPLELEGNLG